MASSALMYNFLIIVMFIHIALFKTGLQSALYGWSRKNRCVLSRYELIWKLNHIFSVCACKQKQKEDACTHKYTLDAAKQKEISRERQIKPFWVNRDQQIFWTALAKMSWCKLTASSSQNEHSDLMKCKVKFFTLLISMYSIRPNLSLNVLYHWWAINWSLQVFVSLSES